MAHFACYKTCGFGQNNNDVTLHRDLSLTGRTGSFMVPPNRRRCNEWRNAFPLLESNKMKVSQNGNYIRLFCEQLGEDVTCTLKVYPVHRSSYQTSSKRGQCRYHRVNNKRVYRVFQKDALICQISYQYGKTPIYQKFELLSHITTIIDELYRDMVTHPGDKVDKIDDCDGQDDDCVEYRALIDDMLNSTNI